MANNDIAQRGPVLVRLQPGTSQTFVVPLKRIHDGNDLNFFLSSTAYRDLTLWLLQLNRSMFPTKGENGKIVPCTLDSPPAYSEAINSLRAVIDALAVLIERAPPSTGPRRFGNVAFRDWHKLAEQEADGLIRTHLSSIVKLHASDNSVGFTQLVDELKAYLIGSFGSAQRLDYGTGHELSFLAFLGSLWKLSAFKDGEERAIVIGVIQPYLELIRKLISTYTLEPAGSHGVWGLDDHNFIPYIFGSAQLGPPIDPMDYSKPVPTEGSSPSAPSPSSVSNKTLVRDYKDSNMYFSAIQFIYDVKKGPFWEHSPILYDISGLKDGWAKINKGMLKMWAAECLGKFPVVQHFAFGSFFAWERDPSAVEGIGPGSVHAQQQPVAAMKSMDVPAGEAGGMGVGTAAPWAMAKGGGNVGVPQMQASTGVPSTRAPWAGRNAHSAAGGTTPTAAPWPSTQRPPASSNAGMAPIAAPWASTPRPPPPPGRARYPQLPLG